MWKNYGSKEFFMHRDYPEDRYMEGNDELGAEWYCNEDDGICEGVNGDGTWHFQTSEFGTYGSGAN